MFGFGADLRLCWQFGEPDLVLSLVCQRQVAMDRYLRRRDATRPDGDEALFIKRCDEFERENPGILQHYNKIIPGRVLEVSHYILSF